MSSSFVVGSLKCSLKPSQVVCTQKGQVATAEFLFFCLLDAGCKENVAVYKKMCLCSS